MARWKFAVWNFLYIVSKMPLADESSHGSNYESDVLTHLDSDIDKTVPVAITLNLTCNDAYNSSSTWAPQR